MSELTVVEGGGPIELGVADEVIKGLQGRLVGLSAGTLAGYEEVKAGISEVRGFRTGVERSRKEMTRSSLDWRNKVNAEAKRVTALLVSIEEPLKLEKQRVDDESKRLREARENAERDERLAVERAERKAAEKVERAEREKQEAEEADKRAAEDAAREEERKVNEAEAVKLAKERDELAEERRKLDKWEDEIAAERQEALEKVEAVKQEAWDKEVKEASIAAQKRSDEAEEVRLAEAKVEADRLAEERKPDVEKLADFADRLSAVEAPTLSTGWAKAVLIVAENFIDDALACLKVKP